MVNSSYRAKDFTNKFSAVTVLEFLQTLALDFSYICLQSNVYGRNFKSGPFACSCNALQIFSLESLGVKL